jgi:hypothetical protein
MVDPIPLSIPPDFWGTAGGAAAGLVAGALVDAGRRWVLDPNMEPEEEEREDPPRRERCE